jgi:hypothetical protein
MTELIDRILEELGAEGLRRAKAGVSSDTLRRAMVFERTGPQSGRLFVPHYWALYHHDGRGAVFPVRKRFLVWFVDPKDDPRLRGGYPVRLSDIRRLTRQEFYGGLDENKRRKKQNPGGGDEQFMRVREVSGPTRASKSYPFFTEGMREFSKFAGEVVQRQVRNEIRPFARVERDRVTARL